MTEIYNLLNSNAITFLCIITFIYVICFLLIRKFSNRHSDFTRYYINNNNIEIEYYYLQANSLEEFFSPKCSKLFSSNIKFKSFEDLSKIFYQVQINKLQEIVHRKIQLLQQHQFNEYHHKEKILLSFSDCSAEERFIECQVEIATAIDNCPVGVVVWFKDVSLDMKYIQKLEIDRDLYSNILNNIPVPIWVRDANNQIFYCNNEYNKIIKLNIKEKIAELTKTSVSITKIARSLKIYSEEKYIITKNERKLFSICEMLFNDNLMLGFALDQSEKERVTKELKQYSDAQNNFLETSSSAIAIYTSDTKIKYFNQAFINLWGLDEKWLFANPTYGEILELLRQKRKLPEQADFSSFKKGHIKFRFILNFPIYKIIYSII